MLSNPINVHVRNSISKYEILISNRRSSFDARGRNKVNMFDNFWQLSFFTREEKLHHSLIDRNCDEIRNENR